MPLDEAYFVWLYSQVGSVDDKNLSKTYWQLLKILYTTPFTWTKKIENDANRAQAGKDLRREFVDQTGTVVDEPDWMDMDCSVLEMLLGLAWKLEWDGGSELSQWFWTMLDNLGLIEFTDANPPDEDFVHHILERLMDRKYEANGAGGLFPLEDPDKDQRQVELWYQAEAYLLERL